MADVRGKTLFDSGLDEFKGQWHKIFPGKKICVEIGCGKGKFVMGMAKLHPERGFVAVESQHDIAFYPARDAMEAKLDNVKVILGNAEGLLEWFSEGEIEELYLNFSDPWPKARHAKRRLTNRKFLHLYAKLLAKGAKLRFKTDNKDLFEFTLEEIEAVGAKIHTLTRDLHHSTVPNEVQTEYEEKFSSRGNKIYFVEISFDEVK